MTRIVLGGLNVWLLASLGTLCLSVGSLTAGEAATGAIRLSEVPLDREYPALVCFKVETRTATYFLEKTGGGLARLLDAEGNDWIGFRPTPGTESSGEYRGFPNAVHQQGGNFFHPRNQATDPSHTRIVDVSQERVTIAVEAESGQWACRYDFFPTHCRFTMTRMPPNRKYWVLYEGTPGGSYDDDDWWMTSNLRNPRPLSDNHDDDISAPEWIAFGDKQLARALFLLHHEDDSYPDRYYPMRREMTVFGFGRSGLDKYLDSVPQRFSLGFVESRDYAAIAEHLERLELVSAAQQRTP